MGIPMGKVNLGAVADGPGMHFAQPGVFAFVAWFLSPVAAVNYLSTARWNALAAGEVIG
jgi:hypothetical protein